METEFGHDALHFVLVLLILVSLTQEFPLENGMDKNLVPGNTIFLLDLKSPQQQVYRQIRKVVSLDFQRISLYISNEIKLS